MSGSDSSMVDEFKIPFLPSMGLNAVQIPLWSMNTGVQLVANFTAGSSDSSMVDEYASPGT